MKLRPNQVGRLSIKELHLDDEVWSRTTMAGMTPTLLSLLSVRRSWWRSKEKSTYDTSHQWKYHEESRQEEVLSIPLWSWSWYWTVYPAQGWDRDPDLMRLPQKILTWSADLTSHQPITSAASWGDTQQSTNSGSNQHDLQMIEELGGNFRRRFGKETTTRQCNYLFRR